MLTEHTVFYMLPSYTCIKHMHTVCICTMIKGESVINMQTWGSCFSGPFCLGREQNSNKILTAVPKHWNADSWFPLTWKSLGI